MEQSPLHAQYGSMVYPVTPLSASGTNAAREVPLPPGEGGPSTGYSQFEGEHLNEDDADGDSDEEHERQLKGGSRSGSVESREKQQVDGKVPVRKKPRITLARGGACVVCRNRKLKCTGERPCKTCQKANIECRYEEIPRKKPRAVMLEERVVELEALLAMRGIDHHDSEHRSLSQTLSPSEQFSPHDHISAHKPSLSMPIIGNQPVHVRTPQPMVNSSTETDVIPGSQLEQALIQVVLPHMPYLLMPVHPQRFLTLLTLPAHDLQRPHPAFLYILFTEAVIILEKNIPPPNQPRLPHSLFPHNFDPPPLPLTDTTWLLPHVRGASLAFLERARRELDRGIRNVDRPYDLARAAIGIARHLYGQGRFIEGWNIPVSRLVISCGLHRMTGIFVPPDGSAGPTELMPKPYAHPHVYLHSHSHPYVPPHGPRPLPVLRMRPVIIPPPRDEIDVAERCMTFWSAKQQDWQAGTGWGWSISMDDNECTTEFPWGRGIAEIRPSNTLDEPFTIHDLHDPASPIHGLPFPDTPYVLAVKSMGLLHRASHLFDLPISNLPMTHHETRVSPSHIPPLAAVVEVETSLRLFRARIPPALADPPRPTAGQEPYDGPSDPWWIQTHMNLYTAEMMMWKEMAHHQRQAYETAVSCARAIVGLAQRLRPESWIHLDMIVALDISLACRFLYKEADRLSSAGQVQAASMAIEEADVLRGCLAGEYAKWLPMAQLHSLIVQRVREGWPEKEGEYERV
ncbi:hypothetical protein M231_00059 [Tremella mesenterica]|uniref:Zn(2)-C6 fungal-type domain-containing protein n=1 Tax=Tremella mesenterica TaxID=5217 RepID=A0A4Q1BWF7_TREME|nr:hypothetical protein M231_00059 [Tremella mesenterica]